MKTLNLILAFTLITATLFAQKPDSTATPTTTKDTSYLKVNGKEIIIIEDKDAFDTKFEEWDDDNDFSKMNVDISWNKRFDGHYGGIELGVNNYLNSDMEMKVPEDGQFMELDDSKSLEFNWNIADVALPIVKNRFGLVTGLGLSWNNYKFDNKQLVLKNDGNELYAEYDSVKTYSKNKLTSVFLNVPLMLEFQQPVGSKELWIAVGGYGGVKIGSHTKLKTNDGDKTKVRKDFHLNTLRYGLRAQVGFDSFGLYCNYSLQSLFKKDEGPELYPISLGVSLAF
ncbi:hypothetical protein L21SP5_01982 [Salinivirga cyanobacteriivorans]|uniref:Outer membrane protein beta-barrel domain-containing protein n=1 Tax=Salinivirga cyanobacteriivorans TaxID=1307839 RepID=A0A0S2I0C2_9BACT|nr:outer membrane beta-barrel protein [Salinivirga cyanobacteriivorans]ALO15620.1 hypothetical protein L21SP5_01981 [Salinivirga cyanobacteriivorans]ALO15621.1 hypothetical protein L21SP5_01982 [Salinivirga cyanobacteriivorans]